MRTHTYRVVLFFFCFLFVSLGFFVLRWGFYIDQTYLKLVMIPSQSLNAGMAGLCHCAHLPIVYVCAYVLVYILGEIESRVRLVEVALFAGSFIHFGDHDFLMHFALM